MGVGHRVPAPGLDAAVRRRAFQDQTPIRWPSLESGLAQGKVSQDGDGCAAGDLIREAVRGARLRLGRVVGQKSPGTTSSAVSEKAASFSLR
ncbi:hypothetical protein GCM10011374_28040 [Kocuria dechangensis]|uniref:Uncharacterized protein n=1 Tax=Kocuria dechangensis TaxID=1176249 RepID=A0A917H025_9MICC|nr:hypothetical protein GCM10011374_28040 [Kocuria dechangensis]